MRIALVTEKIQLETKSSLNQIGCVWHQRKLNDLDTTLAWVPPVDAFGSYTSYAYDLWAYNKFCRNAASTIFLAILGILKWILGACWTLIGGASAINKGASSSRLPPDFATVSSTTLSNMAPRSITNQLGLRRADFARLKPSSRIDPGAEPHLPTTAAQESIRAFDFSSEFWLPLS